MRWRSLCLGLLLATPLVAQAATLGVSPVRLTLSPAHPTGVLNVNNTASDSELVQVQLVKWSQENGKDVFAPTQAILATPPIFRLEGGGTQVIRVGLRTPPTSGKETTYRLFMTQIPPPKQPGFVGLQFALRVSLPIFVDPVTKVAPVLRWSAKLLSPKKLVVNATNVGTAHVQVLRLTLALPAPRKSLSHKAGSYILPGNTAHWDFKLNSPLAKGVQLHVSAKTDQGDFQATLSVEK